MPTPIAPGKHAMPLSVGGELARAVHFDVSPYCTRVAIAGSVRRGKPIVGDVELVCISKPGQPVLPSQGQVGMFDSEIVAEAPADDQLTAYLRDRVEDPTSPWALRPNVAGVTSFGPVNKYMTYDGAPVDIFTAYLMTFGMVFFVRTGDAEWIVRAMAEFKRQGSHAHPYGGVEVTVDGDVTAEVLDPARWAQAEVLCPTEETVFELLGWPFVEPEDRTGAKALELRDPAGPSPRRVQ